MQNTTHTGHHVITRLVSTIPSLIAVHGAPSSCSKRISFNATITSESLYDIHNNVNLFTTLYLAKHPGAPYFVILLCLIPKDFTHHRDVSCPSKG